MNRFILPTAMPIITENRVTVSILLGELTPLSLSV